jgi:hypothetical protein
MPSVTRLGVPLLHRLLAGAVALTIPLAEPHAPSTLATGAEHDAFDPPPLPSHDQSHGPVPVTGVAVPALQRLEAGAALVATPLAVPHTPLTAWSAPAPSALNEAPSALDEASALNEALSVLGEPSALVEASSALCSSTVGAPQAVSARPRADAMANRR